MSQSKQAALEQVEHEIVSLLRRARRAALTNATLVHPDLSAGPFAILQHVAADPRGVRPSAVCEHFGLDKGSVSRQVQTLVALGLVERRPDPSDGRAQVVVATADAELRLKRLLAARRARFQGRLADWTARDLLDLAEVLTRYNDDLSD